MAESSTASNTEQITKTLDPTLLLKDELDQVGRIYNIIVEFFTNYDVIRATQPRELPACAAHQQDCAFRLSPRHLGE